MNEILTNLMATSSFVRMLVPKQSHKIGLETAGFGMRMGLTMVDVAKSTATQFAGQSVFSSDS